LQITIVPIRSLVVDIASTAIATNGPG